MALAFRSEVVLQSTISSAQIFLQGSHFSFPLSMVMTRIPNSCELDSKGPGFQGLVLTHRLSIMSHEVAQSAISTQYSDPLSSLTTLCLQPRMWRARIP